MFGLFGNALLDILLAGGIGPSLRWVDDFLFLSIQRKYLKSYNKQRESWRTSIQDNGGKLQRGGRFWYKGNELPNDQWEEFVEDMSAPLRDLSLEGSNSTNPEYAYTMSDVDRVSTRLGVPWERSKDVPFGKIVPFIGFDWDLEAKTVRLQDKKKQKYRDSINEWRQRKTHVLSDVQKIYGKLLHTCLIVPEGRAYTGGKGGITQWAN